MSKEFYFCRVDGAKHWCVACCETINCTNLGKLPDGTRGCVSYNLKEGDKRRNILPKRPICDATFCWKGVNGIVDGIRIDTPEVLEKMHRKIMERPVGKFKMGIDIILPIVAEIKNKTY